MCQVLGLTSFLFKSSKNGKILRGNGEYKKDNHNFGGSTSSEPKPKKISPSNRPWVAG